MPVRTAEATWVGGMPAGEGEMKLGSGTFKGKFSFGTRFENAPGTNPEELLGAAHAGCFSMALSYMLTQAGFAPERIETSAKVSIEKVGEGFKITRIQLSTQARIPSIDEKTFMEHANKAKTGCPVSQALASTPIELQAKLVR